MRVTSVPYAEQRKAMKVVIEFYRIREADHAHAIVGREIADATDLDDAVEIARRLWQTLDMPQRPDAMTISNNEGHKLYSGNFDPC
jgi:hypothetical protein